MTTSKKPRKTKEERIPELVTDLQDHLTAELIVVVPAGLISHQDAKMIGIKVARHVTNNWGGQLIYFPKNYIGELLERDLQIWNDFNGFNHVELANKYNLTVPHVYRILKEVGEIMRAKTQGKLFND